jgi:hypothetical protein
LDVESVHTAKLEVPFAAGADEILIERVVAPQRRYIFTATSTVSPADARRKVRDFLQAARDAAQE